MNEASPGTWHPIGPQDPTAPPGLTPFKHGGHQLVLVRSEDGRVRALDNRCPHEGYPLAQGELKDCVLTCTWHNWKFDVRDGACLLGGEAVRSYPTRVRDGVLEVDLAPPDPAVEIPRLRASLHQGLYDDDLGRMTRDAVRLLQAGLAPWSLLGELAAYDARHAEYGCTHVLPLAADCGRLLDWHPGLDALYVIAPVLHQCSDTNRRLGERPRADPIAGASRESLREAIEAEDVARAQGLLRGALDAGVPRDTLESWMFTALSDHFTDFGHSLIYRIKLQEMAPHLSPEHWNDIAAGHLYGLLLATREDTLPYMATYSAFVRERRPEFASVQARARRDATWQPETVREAVLDGRAAEACEAVWSALTEGVPGEEVARALVPAAAERLLRFDPAHERDPLVAENWLWATHRLTFAAAVRHAMRRFDRPEGLAFLFQAVAFLHSGRGMDARDRADATPGLHAPATDRSAPVHEDEIGEAVRARDPDLALVRTRAFLANGGSRKALERTLLGLSLEDLWVQPILQAHAVKTTMAGLEESAALRGSPYRDAPLLAAVRFLASPLQEARLRGTVLTSIRWVAEGKMPRKLTQ